MASNFGRCARPQGRGAHPGFPFQSFLFFCPREVYAERSRSTVERQKNKKGFSLQSLTLPNR